MIPFLVEYTNKREIRILRFFEITLVHGAKWKVMDFWQFFKLYYESKMDINIKECQNPNLHYIMKIKHIGGTQ